MLTQYRTNLYASFIRYLRWKYGCKWFSLLNTRKRKSDTRPEQLQQRAELLQDIQIGIDALYQGINATWWEWSFGSTLFHWRWPQHAIKEARDGVPVFVKGNLPHYTARQRWPAEDEKESVLQMKKKLEKVIDRGYLKPGYVKSLTIYFSVPKGL